MKLGIFTDSHYSSQELTCFTRLNSKSLKKIEEAFEYFLKENCDVVICLGDITDKEGEHTKEIENLKRISEVFQKYPVETRIVMGNHDAFCFEVDEFYSILGEQYRPENIYGEKNIIFLDACYFKSGVHYMPGDDDWTDTFYPHTDELKEILSKITGEAYVFMHQNIDPTIEDDLRLYNDAEIRDILEKSGKVKIVFQGHDHFGKRTEHNGIQYITFEGMCEKEGAYYIFEI